MAPSDFLAFIPSWEELSKINTTIRIYFMETEARYQSNST
jgi:hypothetical protein